MNTNQTKHRLGCIIAASASIAMVFGLLGLLVGTGQIYNSYDKLSSAYSDLSMTATSQYNRLVDLLRLSSPGEVPVEPTIIEVPSITLAVTEMLFGASVWLVGVGLLIISLRIYRSQVRDVEAEGKLRVERARKLGRAEGLREVVQGLVEDRDVLADVVGWLQDYRKGEATVEDAARVHGRILERLVKQAHLTPIGQLGQKVKFDPRTHATYDLLAPGATGEIIELGWKVSREVVKKPLVKEVEVQ